METGLHIDVGCGKCLFSLHVAFTAFLIPNTWKYIRPVSLNKEYKVVL